MAEALRDKIDYVPTWSGKLRDIDLFDEDLQIYLESTKREDRTLLRSRIIQRMPYHSAERCIALQLAAEKRRTESGATELVKHLRDSMGNKAPIDIAQTLDAYLYRMIRVRSENMVAYSSREEEAYNKLMNSYKRLKADATNICFEEIPYCCVIVACSPARRRTSGTLPR